MSNRNVLYPIKEEDENDIRDDLKGLPPNDSLLEENKLFEDADEPDLVWLQDTKHKNLFLAKVGLSFTGYFTIWVLSCLIITFKEEKARFYYWVYKLEASKWMYALYAVIIRLLFAFGSGNIRPFSKVLYGLDLLMGFLMIIGMYYYFSLFLKTQYIYHGHYVLLLSYTMFFNSVALTLSALIKDKRNTYNFLMGFILMEIASGATIYTSSYFFDIPTLTRVRYKIFFGLMSLINLYTAVNAYFVVKYRGKKFYDFEYISCFYCFWTDWLYVFWKDATRKQRARRAEYEQELKQDKREKREAELANEHKKEQIPEHKVSKNNNGERNGVADNDEEAQNRGTQNNSEISEIQ